MNDKVVEVLARFLVTLLCVFGVSSLEGCAGTPPHHEAVMAYGAPFGGAPVIRETTIECLNQADKTFEAGIRVTILLDRKGTSVKMGAKKIDGDFIKYGTFEHVDGNVWRGTLKGVKETNVALDLWTSGILGTQFGCTRFIGNKTWNVFHRMRGDDFKKSQKELIDKLLSDFPKEKPVWQD